MLLDDVFSDLDDRRREQLLASIHGRCQTFISTTNLYAVPPDILKDAAIYEVASGKLSRKGKAPDESTEVERDLPQNEPPMRARSRRKPAVPTSG